MMPKIANASILTPLSSLLVAVLLQGCATTQSPGAGASVQRTEYLVFSQCKPGLKAQCDAWYARHIKDLLKIEGLRSAQQYVLLPGRGGMAKDKDRLVVYQLEGDPQVVLARLRPAVEAKRLESPDPALFEMTFQTAVIEKFGPELKAAR